MKAASPSGAADAAFVRPALASEMDEVRRLFRAYQAWLRVDLCYQNFDAELAGLPGAYAAPGGGLWLAVAEGAAVGAVALRPLDGDGSAEMKRLWVQPEAQGLGLGRALIDACLDAARAAGYRRVKLDSLPRLEAAMALYEACGFRPCPRYNDNALPEAVFLEKDLA